MLSIRLFSGIGRRPADWRMIGLLTSFCFTGGVTSAQETEAPSLERVVPVESLLQQPETQFVGCRRYQAVRSVMEGTLYERALITEVMYHRSANSTFSTLSLAVNGKYERFKATVGRDDREATLGPAYCIFEVWGDGRLLTKTPAIRSSFTPVRVSVEFPKRQTPMALDVDIRGVKLLQLKVRYAAEFAQTARYVHRALGCIWAEPRLITRLTPEEKEALDRESVAARAASPLRQTLLAAALLLGEAIPEREPEQPPFCLGIPPLLVEPVAELEEGESEEALRGFVGQVLEQGERSGKRVLTLLTPSSAQKLTQALPAKGVLRGAPDTVAALGRGFGAELLLLGDVRKSEGRWQAFLRLLDTASGKTIREVTVPLSQGGGEP